MDSTALMSTCRQRSLPFLALLRHDLRTLWSGWLVRLWLVLSALLTLLLLLSGWEKLQTSPLISLLVFPYLVFPWFLAVMVLGVDPVSGARIEALADGILSRPVTRYEYLCAAWSARVLTVLGVFLLVIVPAVLVLVFAQRPAATDERPVTAYGIAASLSVVALVLALQVSLGFLLGTLLRRPLVAILILLLVWYPLNMILHTFALEEFSPISLSQSMPTLLKQPLWADAAAAVEPDRGLEEAAQAAAQFMAIFGGPAPAVPKKQNFFERGDYEDFALWRVLLGYGTPTLLSITLATWVFCRRDL